MLYCFTYTCTCAYIYICTSQGEKQVYKSGKQLYSPIYRKNLELFRCFNFKPVTSTCTMYMYMYLSSFYACTIHTCTCTCMYCTCTCTYVTVDAKRYLWIDNNFYQMLAETI